MLNVFGSISTNTGFIPSQIRELVVAGKVKGVVITSPLNPGLYMQAAGRVCRFQEALYSLL